MPMRLVLAILLLHMSCKDHGVTPAVPNWEPLGLEGKLVSELKLIDDYLYACAGRDGLYRIHRYETNAQWEYLGLADSNVVRTLESGVTGVVATNGQLVMSYNAGNDTSNKRGIYRSTDEGQNWQSSDSGMITNYGAVVRLEQSPAMPTVILAGTGIGHVYLTTDGSRSWQRVFGFPEPAGLIHHAISFVGDQVSRVWIGGETGRFAPFLLHTSDQGQSWSDWISFPPNIGPYTDDNSVYDIAVDPTNDSILYFGMLGVIVKTTDKARTFQRILGWEGGIYRHRRLAMNPTNAREILATGFYLYRTLDGGNTWQKIRPPFYVIHALAVDWQQRVLYVSVSSPENGVYKLRF